MIHFEGKLSVSSGNPVANRKTKLALEFLGDYESIHLPHYHNNNVPGASENSFFLSQYSMIKSYLLADAFVSKSNEIHRRSGVGCVSLLYMLVDSDFSSLFKYSQLILF